LLVIALFDIACNKLDDQGTEHIAMALRVNKALKELSSIFM
jgi:hypothetical protein